MRADALEFVSVLPVESLSDDKLLERSSAATMGTLSPDPGLLSVCASKRLPVLGLSMSSWSAENPNSKGMQFKCRTHIMRQST